MKRWRRPAALMGLLIALSGVFASYLRPELTVDLAGRLWACF